MSRRQNYPLRALTDDERSWLQKIARSKREPSSHVARAKQLLAVAAGHSYTTAAKAAGRKSGDAVAKLVAVSTAKVCRPSSRELVVALNQSMVSGNVNASLQRLDDLPTLSRMGQSRDH